MSLVIFYVKEIYIKVICFLVLFLLLMGILFLKSKAILLFILSPIKKIKINNFLLQYENINMDYIKYNEKQITIHEYLPIIEINLPFFTTSYVYIKYIVLFTLYIIIPLALYLIYLSFASVLKEMERIVIVYVSYCFFLFIGLNLIITHYIVIPFFIYFIYSHYYEFLFYEFDIEFQLLSYLNFYFYTLYLNIFLLILNIIKKYLLINTFINILFIIGLLLFPIDLFIQIIYLITYFFFHLISILLFALIKQIKRYKQMEY